ncbi:MAG: type II toxin-antitoxin system VapB family antitoxin [Gemmatimonadota bacterium]|jgi:antitoxin VapB|nr:type II toxin-antitoxin system VapB family antitoxin [Gemmatimonadota bacterium]
MALSIKNLETERLARELAQVTGESLTEAVTEALRQRMLRETGRANDATLDADLCAIQERFMRLPVLETGTDEELVGYDEHGLPV